MLLVANDRATALHVFDDAVVALAHVYPVRAHGGRRDPRHPEVVGAVEHDGDLEPGEAGVLDDETVALADQQAVALAVSESVAGVRVAGSDEAAVPDGDAAGAVEAQRHALHQGAGRWIDDGGRQVEFAALD